MKEKVIGGIVVLQDQFKKHMIVIYRDRSLGGLHYFIYFVKIVLKELMINCVMKCSSVEVTTETLLFYLLKWGREEMFTGERT